MKTKIVLIIAIVVSLYFVVQPYSDSAIVKIAKDRISEKHPKPLGYDSTSQEWDIFRISDDTKIIFGSWDWEVYIDNKTNKFYYNETNYNSKNFPTLHNLEISEKEMIKICKSNW